MKMEKVDSLRKKIFINVPCPVTARNMLVPENSVYKNLEASGHDIVLLAPKIAARLIEEEFGAKVEVVPGGLNKRTKLQLASEFVTKHLNLTPMQILCSKYGLRFNLDKKTIRKDLHFLRVIISKTLGKWLWFRLKVAPVIHMAVFRDRPMKEIFDRHKPDLVFVPNMANPEGEEYMREAVRQKIPTVGMVGSWDHPHKRYLAVQTDDILVWSEAIKNEMIALQSYPADRVHVTGGPHYDMYLDDTLIQSREELFEELGLDPNKKLISFFSCTGRAPDDGDIVDMALKWSDEGRLHKKSQVYIRTYPGDAKGDHEKYDPFADRGDVYIDWLKDSRPYGEGAVNYFPDRDYMRRQISVYCHTDIAVTMYSSISVEISIFNKPSINVNFDGYKDRPFSESVKRFKHQSHFQKLTDTDGVTQVESEEEYLQAINNIFDNPDHNAENISKITEAVCGPVDGKASDRIANFILSRPALK